MKLMKLPWQVNRRFVLGAVALMSAGLAVALANQWVSGERRKLATLRAQLLTDYQRPVEVVVAAKDLPNGAAVESSHLRMAAVPEKFLQPYSVRATKELVGKVTIAPIAEGEQVLLNKVRRPDEAPPETTLSGMLPKGKRAVSIVVDAITGVGGFVRPGDVVDILWTLRLPKIGDQQEQVVTFTLFQDVPVLAVGSELAGRAEKGKREGGGTDQRTVTLGLGPQETSFLLFAREQGRIQLSLRAKQDRGAQVAVAPANMDTLLESALGIQAAKPPPPPPPKAPPRQVEVYKGLERAVVSLPEEK